MDFLFPIRGKRRPFPYSIAWRKGQVVIRLIVILFVVIYGAIYRANILDGTMRLGKTFYLFLVGGCLLASLFLTLLPDRREEKDLKRAPSLFSILFVLGCPMYGYLCAEMVTTKAIAKLGRYSAIIGPSHHSMKLLFLNLLDISLLAFVFIFLSGSLKIGPMLGAMSITFFAIVNFYVYSFRGAAVTASDIFSAPTAVNVMGQYLIIPNDRIYLAYWLMILLWSVAFRIRRHLHVLPKHTRLYFGGLLGGAAVFVLCTNLFITGPFLKDQGIWVSFWNPMKKSYQKIGTALTFASTIRQAIPQAPEGYSPEKAKAVAAPFLQMDQEGALGEDLVEGITVSEERPNIIVIVSESFKDLQKVGDFEVNTKEYLPFLRSLEKTFPTGTVYCQGYGGKTANTEFEFLTGMNVSFLPLDSVPFVTYVKHPLPTMTKIFREFGYVGLEGVHPYRANGYNRNKVYPLLGFNPYFLDDLPIEPEYIRSLASDEGLFENLIYFYEQARKESQAPFFIYTMTMQNHGSYEKEFEGTIAPLGLSNEYKDVERYLTLTQYTDEAMRSLVNYFEGTKEPTVIFMMGDHQPRLNENFYTEVEGDFSYSSDFAREYRLYNVNCYLWANYRLPGEGEVEELKETSMNYMQLNLLRLLGFPLTPFQEYLLELQKNITAINGFAYLGKDGKTYEFTDQQSPYYQLLHDYYILCYNNLLDSQNRVEGFFGPI